MNCARGLRRCRHQRNDRRLISRTSMNSMQTNNQIWPGRFAGQVAAITGAADGLGRAIAERLLAEGATVWFLDRDEARLQSATQGRPNARPLVVDITSEEGVKNAFEKIGTEGRV